MLVVVLPLFLPFAFPLPRVVLSFASVRVAMSYGRCSFVVAFAILAFSFVAVALSFVSFAFDFVDASNIHCGTGPPPKVVPTLDKAGCCSLLKAVMER